MSRFGGWKGVCIQFSECLHVTALPGTNPEALGKKSLVHWQCRLPQSLRRKGAAIALWVAECYFLLLWNGFSNSWMVREFFRIWAHYMWCYRKTSPTCFPAQSISFLDYPSDQSFSKFHITLTSCIWHHSSFGEKETVLLQLKDRTSGSSNQANQTLSTWCILHLHCCLFLLPKTSEISLLCGKSESIIYKSGVTVPFVFISLFSEASSCDKIEATWSWGNWESVSVSLPVLFPMVRNQYLGCCLHTYIGSLVKTRKHRPTARPPWILQPLYFLFCLLPSLIDFFFFLLNLSSVKRGFFCSLLHLRLHSLPSFVCIFCLFYYR